MKYVNKPIKLFLNKLFISLFLISMVPLGAVSSYAADGIDGGLTPSPFPPTGPKTIPAPTPRDREPFRRVIYKPYLLIPIPLTVPPCCLSGPPRQVEIPLGFMTRAQTTRQLKFVNRTNAPVNVVISAKVVNASSGTIIGPRNNLRVELTLTQKGQASSGESVLSAQTPAAGFKFTLPKSSEINLTLDVTPKGLTNSEVVQISIFRE